MYGVQILNYYPESVETMTDGDVFKIVFSIILVATLAMFIVGCLIQLIDN